MDWLYRFVPIVVLLIGLAGVEERMSALKPPPMAVTLHALLHPEPLPPPPPPPVPVDPMGAMP